MCPILLKHWAKIHLYSKAMEDTTWWGDSCCYYTSIQILHQKSPVLGLTSHIEYKIKSTELHSTVLKMKIYYKWIHKKNHSTPLNNNPLTWFITHNWQYWRISSSKPLWTFYSKNKNAGYCLAPHLCMHQHLVSSYHLFQHNRIYTIRIFFFQKIREAIFSMTWKADF